MRRSAGALGLGAILAAATVSAAATLDPPDPTRYVRWGPLRLRPGFQLTNLGYDDNIFLDNARKVGDYTATLSPRVEGLVLFGSGPFLEFTQVLDYTVYADNGDQNYLDRRSRARFTLPLQRLGVYAEGALNRVRSRPVDQEDVRPKRRERRVGAGVVWPIGWRTDLQLGLFRRDWEYSDDDGQGIGERLNRDESGRELRLGYRLRGRTRLIWQLETLDIRFDSSQPLRDSRQWDSRVGLEFSEGGRLTGELRLGWAEIDADDPGRIDFSDLVGVVELAYRAGARGRLRFEAEREPGFAVVGEGTYFLNTRQGLRYVRYFNRFLGAESGLASGRLTFPGSSGNGGLDRRDDILEYDVGLRFRLAEDSLGRRTEYAIRIGRFRRDSTDPARDRTRSTFDVSAVFGF